MNRGGKGLTVINFDELVSDTITKKPGGKMTTERAGNEASKLVIVLPSQ